MHDILGDAVFSRTDKGVTDTRIGGLNLRFTDPNSIAGRLHSALLEAVDEWQENPNGDIKFCTVIVGNTFTEAVTDMRTDKSVLKVK